MDPLVATDTEHGHNVFVVQQSCSLSLYLKALALPRVERRGRWEDLQCDAPTKRKLLGLVHDTHAAASDLAPEFVLAQLLRLNCNPGALLRRKRCEFVTHLFLESMS